MVAPTSPNIKTSPARPCRLQRRVRRCPRERHRAPRVLLGLGSTVLPPCTVRSAEPIIAIARPEFDQREDLTGAVRGPFALGREQLRDDQPRPAETSAQTQRPLQASAPGDHDRLLRSPRGRSRLTDGARARRRVRSHPFQRRSTSRPQRERNPKRLHRGPKGSAHAYRTWRSAARPRHPDLSLRSL